jgi:hypothetical protein
MRPFRYEFDTNGDLLLTRHRDVVERHPADACFAIIYEFDVLGRGQLHKHGEPSPIALHHAHLTRSLSADDYAHLAERIRLVALPVSGVTEPGVEALNACLSKHGVQDGITVTLAPFLRDAEIATCRRRFGLVAHVTRPPTPVPSSAISPTAGQDHASAPAARRYDGRGT